MADASPGVVAVTLSVPPAFEERVFGWLLARDDTGTFTSRAVHCYGADSRTLSVAEQVSGRQRRTEIEIQMAADVVDRWLEDFAETFAAMPARYCVTPVLRSGRLPSSI